MWLNDGSFSLTSPHAATCTFVKPPLLLQQCSVLLVLTLEIVCRDSVAFLCPFLSARFMLDVAKELEIPCIATEQCPKVPHSGQVQLVINTALTATRRYPDQGYQGL